MRRFCTLSFLLFSFSLHAQNSVWGSANNAKASAGKKIAKGKKKAQDLKKQLQEWGMDDNYNHELLLGGKANSNGWSGSIYHENRVNKTTNNIWELHFSEIKHDKQIKIQGGNAFPQLGASSPFIFGKQNNLYTLQFGVGKEKLLLPAVLEDNLSISFRYAVGASLAMLKPYYLKLVYTDDPTGTPYLKQEKYSNDNRDIFLNNGAILGASNWTKGLGEIDYVPGIYAELAFVIMPAKNKSFIQLITLGANGAFYSRSLPIMVDQQAYPWQASLFAGLALGKRWK